MYIKNKIESFFTILLLICLKFIIRTGRNLNRRLNHRIWSNSELKQFGHLFTGEICNVSGWEDSARDNTGRHYKDFFPNAKSYSITNFFGNRGSNNKKLKSQYNLDLEKKLDKSLINKFDVVFNHTTLEHIYDVELAIKNLSLMTKDIVIVVVPFIQEQHYDKGSYGDYWRFTQMTLCKLFEKNKINPLYISSNDNQPWYPTYIFFIGSKKIKNWDKKIKFDFNKYLNYKIGSQVSFW